VEKGKRKMEKIEQRDKQKQKQTNKRDDLVIHLPAKCIDNKG
jgi:hypothetical protein